MWKLTYKWATWRHNNKPKPWIVDRYFGKHNKFRNDQWVFGNPDNNTYLVKFSWTDIVRHVMVTGAASPDDPALTDYWAKRRHKVKPPLDNYTLRLLTRQEARCPLCGDHLLAADQPPQSPHDWERWWLKVTRKAIAVDYLVHHGRPADRTTIKPVSCTPPATAGYAPANAGHQHSQPARPRGLLEPYAATSGSCGSQGAPDEQSSGATRRKDALYGPRPRSTTPEISGSGNG